MVRIGIIVILFLSVIWMIKGIAETWEKEAGSLAIPAAKQVETSGEEAGPDLRFNPEVPSVLPQLGKGYLFNAERLLEDEAEKFPETEADMSADETGIKTDITGVTYSGSLITDTLRWAIITYAAVAESTTDQGSRLSRLSRVRKPASKTTETSKIAVGDLVSGYKVAAIEPDKIVFTKGGEQVVKYLYDPDKKRAPSSAKPVTGLPSRPEPGVPPNTTRPLPPSPETPGAQTTNAVPPVPSVRRPPSGRRLIISRKPTPQADASRWSKQQGQGADGNVADEPPPPPPGEAAISPPEQ